MNIKNKLHTSVNERKAFHFLCTSQCLEGLYFFRLARRTNTNQSIIHTMLLG